MPSPTLARRLGPYDAAAIVISNVIGSGIFIAPAFIAQLSPHPWAMLGAWLAGGLLAFAGAMAYAELAALRPKAGGEYVYLREAFGPLAAFLTGWTSFVAGFSGAVAAGAVGLASYLGRFVPAAAETTPIASLPLGPLSLTLSPQSVVALACIAALSFVHVRGLGPGRLVQNVLAGLKVSALMLLIALGFAIGRGSVEHLVGGGSVAPASWLLALIPVMFSYSGWNAAAYVAEEVRDPERNVPRALAIGTGAVIAIYLALNVLYLYSMPVTELAGLKVSVVDEIAGRLLGGPAANALALLAIVSIAASISAMVLAGPRVYYAMARDGLFLEPASRIHPRFQTPAIAIVAQAIWSGLLVLSGTFGQLLEYTGFAVVLFASVAVAALFVLRWRSPAEPRPFRAWGYPVAPALFVISGALIVANAMWRAPGPSLAGMLLILAGVPIYLLLRLRRPARVAA